LNNKDCILLLINDWKPKLIFLSETHVSADVELVELNIRGYRVESCATSNRRTGGVMVFVRDDIKYKISTVQCESNYVWLLSIEFCLNRIKYLCTVMYHPPQTENAKFVDYFSNYLDSVSTFDGINIIVGDFNFDLLKPSFYGEKILSQVYVSGFSQIVASPTRITDRSQTLIDYIITNKKSLSYEVHLTPKISDHCILSIHPEQDTNKQHEMTVCCRSMKHYVTIFPWVHTKSI